jgi:hypothetical protein
VCPFKYLTNGVADVAAALGFVATLPFLAWVAGARSRLGRAAAPLSRRPAADA